MIKTVVSPDLSALHRVLSPGHYSPLQGGSAAGDVPCSLELALWSASSYQGSFSADDMEKVIKCLVNLPLPIVYKSVFILVPFLPSHYIIIPSTFFHQSIYKFYILPIIKSFIHVTNTKEHWYNRLVSTKYFIGQLLFSKDLFLQVTWKMELMLLLINLLISLVYKLLVFILLIPFFAFTLYHHSINFLPSIHLFEILQFINPSSIKYYYMST